MSLKGINTINEAGVTTALQASLKYYFDWGLLSVGGFFNVHIPTSGQYGGQQHILRCVNDPNYPFGSVWEGFRKDWVWESGIPYGTQPIQFSGVNVNGTFHPATGIGAYAHRVDYPLGRIVFSSPISSQSQITAEYSYRWSQWLFDDQPWFQAPEYWSFRFSQGDPNFLPGSGQWNRLAQDRLEMPAVVIQAGRRRPTVGYQLGGGQKIYQDMIFNIIAEDSFSARRLRDILLDQDEANFYLFNLDALASGNRYPLLPNGSLNPNNPPTFPLLESQTNVGGFMWRYATFKNTNAGAVQKLSSNFYFSAVTSTIEVLMPLLT